MGILTDILDERQRQDHDPVLRAHGAAFDAKMSAVNDTAFDEHRQAELKRLSPLFNAAAAAIAPHAANAYERALATPEGLAHVFAQTSGIYRAMMLNEPLVLRDGVADSRRMPAYGLRMNIPALPPDTQVTQFQPRYGPQPRRMFDTGYFGFFSLLRRQGADDSSAIVVPFISLPQSFMDVVDKTGAQDLTGNFGTLAALANHDWFHSILIGTINRNATQAPEQSPALRYLRKRDWDKAGTGDNRVWQIVRRHSLRENDRLLPQHPRMSDPFEEWAMRLQRETLTHMAAQPDNPLARAVDAYLDSWRNFARLTAKEADLPDMRQSPAAFALRLLAFNLVRAVPRDHDLVARSIAADNSGQAAAIFDRMYDTLMARRTLFGPGPGSFAARNRECHVDDKMICATPAEYGAVVLGGTAESLHMAHLDARDAHYMMTADARKLTEIYCHDGSPHKKIPDPFMQRTGL